nr:MAG TPA: hypothetical protein [Caudoviricetes sp.]
MPYYLNKFNSFSSILSIFMMPFTKVSSTQPT